MMIRRPPPPLLVAVIVAMMSLVLPELQARAQSTPPTCPLPAKDDGKKPTSNIARTDTEIAAALKQAIAEDPRADIDTRSEIIMQGVFGPCFMVTVRDVQFEFGWLSRPLDSFDRGSDTQLAADGMERVVRLFRAHKIPLESRVANVIIQRYSGPGNVRYLTVHWPVDVLRRALSSPKNADHIMRSGYLVHDGENAPQAWLRPDLFRR
jgi:hypothetical protein